MSGATFMDKVRSAFRKEPSDWNLSDTAPFDFADDLDEDEMPKFNQLKVVVAGDVSDYSTGAVSNGVSVNTMVVDDDDSLLGSSSSLGSPGLNMDPCDNCNKKRERIKQRRVMKKLGIAAVLYLLFMIGEFVGGYVANSLAIMTDALHMLADLIGILVSLLALWLSAKPPTAKFTFGLHRLEVVSAGISVLLIYILTGVLLYEAVQRTMQPDFNIDGDVMLITAAVGVAVNLVMGFLLNQNGHLHSHGHGHSHGNSHGHSHGPAASPAAQPSGEGAQHKPHGSLAVRAAFIHALGDLVQSVGVLIAAYIVRFKVPLYTDYTRHFTVIFNIRSCRILLSILFTSQPEYKVADPICTYIFSVLVLFTTIRIIRDTGLIILEAAPRHLDVQRIREDLLKLEDVQSVDELNVWALTSDKTAALVHLQLLADSASKWEDVQAKARHLMLHTYSVSRCTVQVQTHRHRLAHTCTHCHSSCA
ncbi:Zinc transporter 4 [Merluccius polli]|uniref:Zinc transporter 4 n=1 Tax=Merluccius polli TaxID=89951 RepID=A0AA47N5U4_MERPO|nr:Zinc transporter 4 [Merluccius polli]